MTAVDDPGPRRRLLLSALIATGTVIATRRLAEALAIDGLSVPDGLILIGFTLTFAWISTAFWTALAGFWVLGRWGPAGRPAGLTPALTPMPDDARTALLMTICHEDIEPVGMRLEAMVHSLARTGELARFDLFILSDSQDPLVVRQERALLERLRTARGAGGHLFYRNRRPNPGRKAGNIAEFCRRWGRRYRYFVVLDADSVMSGATLVHLARLMEANPEAGLIQTAPRLVGGVTLFARILQFAAGLYGALFSAGLAHWFPGESNYWGHNAIIRTRAFMASAGLPTLPGSPPLGGEILSHDFVEAALLRRAGWSVWLVPDLDGSYEELPPTLGDYIRRDRRWCQGNLQHLRLLAVKGLCSVSRMHLATGAMAYLVSPVLLTLLLATTFEAARVASSPSLPLAVYGLDGGPSAGGGALLGLCLITAGMLVLPRLLALALALADPARRHAFGGARRLVPSALVEWLFSVLLAPVLLVEHARAVVTVILGRRVSWVAQQRAARAETWRGAVQAFGGISLLGGAWAGIAAWLAPDMLLWLSPILTGLLLAVPIAVLTSRTSLGQWTRHRGWLLIPEEVTPPVELAALPASTVAAAPGETGAAHRPVTPAPSPAGQ